MNGLPLARMLVAGFDPGLVRPVAEFFGDKGHRVVVVAGGREALVLLRSQPFDVALLDLGMPEVDGLVALRAMQADAARPECIVIAGEESIDTAIEAVRLGAYGYVGRPFRMKELDALVTRAGEKRRLITENREMAARLATVEHEEPVDSVYAPMHAVMAMARRLAPTDTPVLIAGQPGTGKSTFARFLHRNSGRATGPLVHAPCAAMGAGGGAIAFFGSGSDGDSVGADGARGHGLLELARGGTLVLEDVDLLDASTQFALADAMARGAFRRLDGGQMVEADVRVVATTTAKFDPAGRNAAFHPHLGTQLSQAVVVLPSLAERSVDIPRLAQAFLSGHGRAGNAAISAGAIDALQRYDWPGNLREFRGVLERAALAAAGGSIASHDVSFQLVSLRRDPDEALLSLADVERRHIALVLQHANWHQGRAAAHLGISAKTLYRKIREYGFTRPSPPTHV